MKFFTIQYLTVAALLAFAASGYAQQQAAGLGDVTGLATELKSVLTNPTELTSAAQNLAQEVEQAMGSATGGSGNSRRANGSGSKKTDAMVHSFVNKIMKQAGGGHKQRRANEVSASIDSPKELMSSATDFIKDLMKEVTGSADGAGNMNEGDISKMASGFVNDLEKTASGATQNARRDIDLSQVSGLMQNVVGELQQTVGGASGSGAEAESDSSSGNQRRDAGLSQLTSMLDSLTQELQGAGGAVRRDASLDGLESKVGNLEKGMDKNSLGEIKKQLCGLQGTIADLTGQKMSQAGSADIKKLQQILSLNCKSGQKQDSTAGTEEAGGSSDPSSSGSNSHAHMKSAYGTKKHGNSGDKHMHMHMESQGEQSQGEQSPDSEEGSGSQDKHTSMNGEAQAGTNGQSAEGSASTSGENEQGNAMGARDASKKVDEADSDANDATKEDTPLLGSAYKAFGGVVRRRRPSA